MELVTADALEPAAVNREAAAPDAVINLLTAIPARLNTRRMAQQLQLTNRLRTEERGISWRPPPRMGCDAFWRKVWRMPMIPRRLNTSRRRCAVLAASASTVCPRDRRAG